MSTTKIIDKVGLCVLRNGSVLLARSKGDALFQIPGGKVEAADVDDLAALTRETEEELGVTLTRESAEFLGLFSAPAAGKPGVIVAVKLYSAAFEGNPSAQSEIEELRWQPLDGPEPADVSDVVGKQILPFLRAQT